MDKDRVIGSANVVKGKAKVAVGKGSATQSLRRKGRLKRLRASFSTLSAETRIRFVTPRTPMIRADAHSQAMVPTAWSPEGHGSDLHESATCQKGQWR